MQRPAHRKEGGRNKKREKRREQAKVEGRGEVEIRELLLELELQKAGHT
jgi:hypothetical protein